MTFSVSKPAVTPERIASDFEVHPNHVVETKTCETVTASSAPPPCV
jgi:hypothetical protein